jgi:hypothetical protein
MKPSTSEQAMAARSGMSWMELVVVVAKSDSNMMHILSDNQKHGARENYGQKIK